MPSVVDRRKETRRSRNFHVSCGGRCFEVFLALSSTAIFAAFLLQDTYLAGSPHRRRSLLGSVSGPSVRWATRDSLPPEDVGCAGDTCWAGVYVDSVSEEILHLARGGRAFFSPGTAAGTHEDTLWWNANGDFLRLVTKDGRPWTWPGAEGDLRRDRLQPGVLAGFGTDLMKESGAGIAEHPHLVRDPYGFFFPGCIYVLSLQRGSQSRAALSREHRVMVNEDGTVTDIGGGMRVARWSFPATKPLVGGGDESWVTGDEVLLLLENNIHSGLQRDTKGYRGGGREIKLSSADGGRTWLPKVDQGQASGTPGLQASARSRHVGGFVSLALVLPDAVSMFPSTSAVRPLVDYLIGAEGQDPLEHPHSIAVDGTILQPLVGVFEAQPFRLMSDHSRGPAVFQGVIVISRAVPRPSENIADLYCVMNGISTRAVWLSWSMLLCSTAPVKREEEISIYVAFQGKRFSTETSFRHAPPARHLRLAWPATEIFDDLLPRLAQNDWRPELSRFWTNYTAPGVSDVARLGTTLAVCTMFKDEAPYLEEWLQYHRLLGVSKVYLYDNGSSDKSREVLKKFEASNFVQVRHWAHNAAQTEALNDCLCRFRHTTRWMSFIDVDEFVDPAPSLPIKTVGNPQQIRTKKGVIGELDEGAMASRRKRFLHLLEEWAPGRHTHCMAWVNYCSYGQLSKAKGGIIENFLQLEDMGERKIHMQKPIFKAMEALTLRRIGPHFLLYATEGIDTQYNRNLKCPYEWLDTAEFRIRHYRSKSLEEYVQRRAGADSAYKAKRYTRQQLESEWKDTNMQCN